MEFSAKEDLQSSKLSQLYDTYENKMYGIAYSILNNVEQSEDAVHDAFLKLIPYLPTIQKVDSIKTKRLVTYTVKNIAIDMYRKNKKENNLFAMNMEEQVTIHDQAGISSFKSVEDRHMIVQLLAKLPSKYREIIQYRCFYGLSYKEISSILKISECVATKRYERAKNMVKEMIGDDVYES